MKLFLMMQIKYLAIKIAQNSLNEIAELLKEIYEIKDLEYKQQKRILENAVSDSWSKRKK